MEFTENQESEIKDPTQSQEISTVFASTKSKNSFGPKLSIKLQENNYLLWNQQLEGVILTQKMHKLVVNPHIPQKFKSAQDRIIGTVSEEYEAWIMQDQVVFICNGSLLLTQSKYIKDLLARAKMDNDNGVITPMLSTCKVRKHGTNHFFDPQLYKSIMGAL
ncbi:hypothetical protein KIW84_058074 [Lathyrus oleraceus]|uniref:Uncharacterized protein n=1 Tax=Pisum sativum TaxID=3888 RepID=A0A9D4X7Y0_PEA|nr:hypothetical protein KIW84_058074 [Pisum sativum]